jgi:hypothetical protein
MTISLDKYFNNFQRGFMSDRHSDSECENILSADIIENNLINNSDHISQLNKIIISKGKLIVYLSIIYGAISAAGLIYLFVF